MAYLGFLRKRNKSIIIGDDISLSVAGIDKNHIDVVLRAPFGTEIQLFDRHGHEIHRNTKVENAMDNLSDEFAYKVGFSHVPLRLHPKETLTLNYETAIKAHKIPNGGAFFDIETSGYTKVRNLEACEKKGYVPFDSIPDENQIALESGFIGQYGSMFDVQKEQPEKLTLETHSYHID